MRRKRREKSRQAKKRSWPTITVTILLWVALATLIYFIDPDTIAAIPLFFLLLTVSVFFTSSNFFKSTRRGFVVTTSTIFFLMLAHFGIGNVVNLLLIAGVAVSFELWFNRMN